MTKHNPGDEFLATGNAVEAAFRALTDHIGDCRFCAWLGDSCTERDVLISEFLKARVEHARVLTGEAARAVPPASRLRDAVASITGTKKGE